MIKVLDINDVDVFIKVREDSLRINPKSFGAESNVPIDRAQTLERFMIREKNEENFILAYYEGETIIGMLGFMRNTRSKIRHKGFIWGVFVYPEHRGKGIGLALINECIKRSSKLEGLQKITLSVTSASESALALYKKVGFEIFGCEKNASQYEGTFCDEIYMDRTF